MAQVQKAGTHAAGFGTGSILNGRVGNLEEAGLGSWLGEQDAGQGASWMFQALAVGASGFLKPFLPPLYVYHMGKVTLPDQ